MRVGIMVPDLVPNDAVGNDALGMYLSLVRRGVETYLFTQNGTANSPISVFHYDDALLLLTSAQDLLIYHYCIGDDLAVYNMRRIGCRIVIKYHNVTPAEFLMAFSNEYARVSRVGRELLLEVADLPVVAFLSDSSFNAAELARIAPASITSLTLPPFHHSDQLLGTADDGATLGQITSHWFNVLVVGRVVPNKGFEALLESFAEALREAAPNVHLHIVGGRDERLKRYLDRLQRIILRNKLSAAITWHGSVGPRALATLYRHSDLFWTASHHEGFCVPVVEAMAFGLPVLATRQGALPETCGDAGAFADGKDETVEILGRLIVDDELRGRLRQSGLQRYRDNFQVSLIERRFRAVLDQICASSEEKVVASSLRVEGDWFGIPDAPGLIGAGLAVADPLHPAALAGRDRRLDFVDWLLREGWRRSPEIVQRLNGREFRAYAEDIEVPPSAAQLDPVMRLRWRFNRVAGSGFDLRSPENVSAFLRWCRLEQEGAYTFAGEPCAVQ